MLLEQPKGDHVMILKDHGKTQVYLKIMGGRKIVEKRHRKQEYSLKGIIRLLTHGAANSLRDHSHLRSYVARYQSEVFGYEAKVLAKWHEAGIMAPLVIEASKNKLVLEYIEGANYRDILRGSSYQEEVFAHLLTTYHGIRKLAQSAGDSTLLHPDAQARNFLYCTQRNMAYAIDPGVIINSSLPFETVDSLINLFFLYQIDALDAPHGDKYMEQFIASFEEKAREKMRENNRGLSYEVLLAGQLLYLLRSLGNKKRISLPYTKVRTQKISAMLR